MEPSRTVLDEHQSNQILVHGYLRRETFTYRPVKVGQSAPPNGGDPSDPTLEGTPGSYDVEFTLAPPSTATPHEASYELGANAEGDSLLQIVAPAPRKETDAAKLLYNSTYEPKDTSSAALHVTYDFLPNDDGFVSRITTTIMAQDLADAERVAWKNLAPILSQIAFIYDVPLDVTRIRCEEKESGIARVVFFRQPYKRVSLDRRHKDSTVIPEHYHPLVYYREALSSTSPHYQYLCFFKVIEMAQALKIEENQHVLLTGGTPTGKRHLLTDNQWLQENLDLDLHSKVVGRKFNDIIDNVLKPLRHRIAHHLLDEESTGVLGAEEILDIENVYLLLPLAHYIARELVASQLDIHL